MTMLKTYRKRRKRLRGYFTYGFDYDPRTMEVTAYINGKSVPRATSELCYPFAEHLESFTFTVTKGPSNLDAVYIGLSNGDSTSDPRVICPQCNKPLDSGELLSCERCGTKMCGCCVYDTYSRFSLEGRTEVFICERCFQKNCEKEDLRGCIIDEDVTDSFNAFLKKFT